MCNPVTNHVRRLYTICMLGVCMCVLIICIYSCFADHVIVKLRSVHIDTLIVKSLIEDCTIREYFSDFVGTL